MRLLTIPNQSVAKGWDEFDDGGRMKLSPCCVLMVDLIEDLVRLALPTCDIKDHHLDRYSERVESHDALSRRVCQTKVV